MQVHDHGPPGGAARWAGRARLSAPAAARTVVSVLRARADLDPTPQFSKNPVKILTNLNYFGKIVTNCCIKYRKICAKSQLETIIFQIFWALWTIPRPKHHL